VQAQRVIEQAEVEHLEPCSFDAVIEQLLAQSLRR
jgi:hypothetical protein